MASLRKFKCYRTLKDRAYTRKSKFKNKGYINSVPANKIVKFDMGDATRTYTYAICAVSRDDVQIRHNAIEAARQMINRRLTKVLGAKGYHLKVNMYPHHILRENKMLSGARADRLQTGMSHAFGKAISLAARVKKGKTLFTAYVDDNGLKIAHEALKAISPKLPGKISVVLKK